MNAGLSNLHALKSVLLPAAMVEGTDFDGLILGIGKGVANQLEGHCSRKFARTVDDVFECGADRLHVSLPRFPLEAVTKYEQRDRLADDWQEQTAADLVENQSNDAGLVWFGSMPGFYPSQLRITYTGGLWFETLEPADEGFPSTMPEGAAQVPPALLLAWQLQCEHVWQQKDKLGLQIAQKPEAAAALAQVKLLDAVVSMVRPFTRYNLTA